MVITVEICQIVLGITKKKNPKISILKLPKWQKKKIKNQNSQNLQIIETT